MSFRVLHCVHNFVKVWCSGMDVITFSELKFMSAAHVCWTDNLFLSFLCTSLILTAFSRVHYHPQSDLKIILIYQYQLKMWHSLNTVKDSLTYILSIVRTSITSAALYPPIFLENIGKYLKNSVKFSSSSDDKGPYNSKHFPTFCSSRLMVLTSVPVIS